MLKEYFYEMQDILFNELPIMGLYFETSTVYYNKALGEQLTPKINDIYSGINNFVFSKTVE